MRERRSEWLHILLGFVCVLLVLNTLALAILYFHVEKTVERLHGPGVLGDGEHPVSPQTEIAHEAELRA